MTKRRTLTLLLLLFLALPVIAFPELLFNRQTLFQADISRIHYPYHIMVAGEWLSGRVPLWNPYQHIGIPLLAEPQVSVLSPLSAIFLSPLPPALELSLFILIHLTLGGLSAVWLGRCLGLRWPSAVVVGLAFGLGGFLMAQVGNTNIMTGAAFLPLLLAATIWSLRRRSWLAAALAGIPLALQIVTAQPQVVLYSASVVLAYAAYRIVADLWAVRGQRPATGWLTAGRSLLLIAVLLASGLMLGAPQLLPSLELQQQSVRSQEQGYDFLTANSLPPVMLLNLVLPSLFGNNVTGFKGGDPFAEDFVYIGFVALVLVFFSWRQYRRRDMPFFGLLLLAAGLLAMGRFTPLYRHIVQYLPGFSLFRIPSRWLMVVNLALAVLAGYGLETLLLRRPSLRRLAPLLAVLAGLLIGLVSAWVFRQPLLAASAAIGNEFQRRLAGAFLEKGFVLNAAYLDRILLRRLTWLLVPVFLLALNVILTAALFVLYAARRLQPRSFGYLVAGLLAFDLVLAGGTTINPVRSSDWWRQLSGGSDYVMAHLDGERVFPLGMGTEQAAVINLGQFWPSAYHVHSAGGHGSPLMLARQKTFLDEAHPVQQVEILGVRYLLTEGRLGADAEATFPRVFQDDVSVVYENTRPLPRAFIVHRALAAADAEAALEPFLGNELDPHQTVVLEATAVLPDRETASGDDSVHMLRDEPQRIDIATHSAQAGYLVLLDSYYPGWVASVDDRPVPIYRADYVVRAVELPAGDHLVRFRYRPWPFYGGAVLALIMLVVIAVLVWRQPLPRTFKNDDL